MISNILLIGVGPHSKRVYIPWLMANPKYAKLAAVVELDTVKTELKQYLASLNIDPDVVVTKKLTKDRLPKELMRQLDEIVARKKIDSIIIASEPTAHLQYALWALERGLHILMDKPITTRPHASTSLKAAKKILNDYNAIERAHRRAKTHHPNLVFSVNVQRRFDPKFDRIRELISGVTKKTGCPITSIQSSTADGQWRLPNEIIELSYHGFNEGFGKGSHSGYHTFDVLCQFIAGSTSGDKVPTSVEIITSATRPQDFFAQLSPQDYPKFFDKKNLPKFLSNEELQKVTKKYGEIDLFVQLVFRRGQNVICTTQSSLLHNSYSMRSWIRPNPDLYKGNGRVKQEHYFIEQGPFQAIQVHSYQSFEKDADKKPFDINGKGHFEIHIFRNSALIGGKSYEKISGESLVPTKQDKLSTELEGKALVMEEFFAAIRKKSPNQVLRSDISNHKNAVRIMSGTYIAQILKKPHKVKLADF